MTLFVLEPSTGAWGAYVRSIARVLDGRGMVVGAGFLIRPDTVVTCAHVVSVALGRDPADDRLPPEPLLIDFPMSRERHGRRPTAMARVSRWSPIRGDGTGDIALLKLDTAAPSRSGVPPLRGGGGLWGHEYRVLGFPADMIDGVWTTGRIRGAQGTGWLQLQGAATDQCIDEGYSGSPVWDGTAGAVVGITVARARDRATTTAYVIPIAQVLDLDRDLPFDAAPDPSAPDRTRRDVPRPDHPRRDLPRRDLPGRDLPGRDVLRRAVTRRDVPWRAVTLVAVSLAVGALAAFATGRGDLPGIGHRPNATGPCA